MKLETKTQKKHQNHLLHGLTSQTFEIPRTEQIELELKLDLSLSLTQTDLDLLLLFGSISITTPMN